MGICSEILFFKNDLKTNLSFATRNYTYKTYFATSRETSKAKKQGNNCLSGCFGSFISVYAIKKEHIIFLYVLLLVHFTHILITARKTVCAELKNYFLCDFLNFENASFTYRFF